jgi:signal transduction histidine kinase
VHDGKARRLRYQRFRRIRAAGSASGVCVSHPRAKVATPKAPEAGALPPVLDALPYATAAYDAGSGALVAANTRFRAAFAELPFDDRARLLAAIADPDSQTPGEVRLANDRWYRLRWSETQGTPALALLSAIDISERIEALDSRTHQQEKLLFTSRMMSVGEMAATLAHELNQPLAAIVNYLNGSLRLVDQAGGPAQVARALTAARTQAEHAAAVISRVREFVRAREPRRDAQDIAAIVRNVIELLRLETERLRLSVDLALAPDLPPVYADRVMIEQVLLNLVKNAIEAMREVPSSKRALRIEGRRTLDDEIELRVLDRGPGMSEEERGQVFSPFFTTKADGLGIGLAICRSIIEYHQGRLFLEAREGGGSVFGFTLPLVRERRS